MQSLQELYGSDNCVLVKSRLFQDEQLGKCENGDGMNLTTIIHPSKQELFFFGKDLCFWDFRYV